MKRSLVLALSAICVTGAFAQNLYSNQSSNVNVAQLNAVGTSGSGVAAPAGGFWSECQTDGSGFANTSAGFTVIGPTFRLADDFTVTGGGWNVTGLKVYAYQTGSTGLPFTGGSLNIWNAAPNAAGAAIIGTGTWTGGTDIIQANPTTTGNIFRIFNTTTPPPGTAPGTTRRIWENNFSLSMSLAAGTYWIDYQLNATAGFAPTTTHQGLRGVAGANAMQSNAGTWAALMDTGNPAGGQSVAQDMPFIVTGTPVPEPGTIAALGLGALVLLRRRSKKA